MSHYNSLYEYVVTVIADITGIEMETFNNGMQHIYNDLNIDSFQATQILQVFQEAFDIEINQEDFQDAYYISDIVNVLENLGATVEMVNTDSSGENGNGESGDDDVSIISEDDVDEGSRQASYTDVVPYTNLFAASSRLLTYKDLLDTAKRYSKHYVGGTSLESKCYWETEKFTTTAATFTTGIRYWSNVLSDFTVLYQQGSNFKEFNTGSNYTHLLSFANTVTIAMRPTLSFKVSTMNPISDEDEGTDYGVSPASIDFDDEGSESGNIDDTGITYNGRSSGSGGASTFANYATSLCSSTYTLGNCLTISTTTLPGYQEMTNPTTGVCDGRFCGADFTSNCASICPDGGCDDCDDGDDCSDFTIVYSFDTCQGGTCITTTTYTISFCATAFIKGTNIGLASCSATMYTTTPKNDNVFDTLYMKIPKYTYFTLSSKPTSNFGISLNVSINSTSTYNNPSCSVTGTIKSGQTAYLFNSNDKTMKSNIAQTIFSGGYLKSN